uniref:Uncharacterized protein n=1 Tax=Anopheles culicifacies TaxID=139723 RepID=A0A182MHK1_9DIPT
MPESGRVMYNRQSSMRQNVMTQSAEYARLVGDGRAALPMTRSSYNSPSHASSSTVVFSSSSSSSSSSAPMTNASVPPLATGRPLVPNSAATSLATMSSSLRNTSIM